jgi:hypothetical protein
MGNDPLDTVVPPARRRQRKPKQAEDVAAGPVTSPVLTLVPSPEDLTELDREAEEQAARAAELAAEEPAFDPLRWEWPEPKGAPLIKWSVYSTKLVAVKAVLTEDPRWEGAIWRDVFRCQNMAGPHQLTDDSPVQIAHWIGAVYGEDVSAELCRQALQLAALDNKRDLLVSYLTGLVWDGTPRLEKMLSEGFGVEPIPVKNRKGEPIPGMELVGQIGRRWMIQAARRALEPGCKADNTLIVYSAKQGQHKSTAFRVLAGAEWFSDSGIPIGQDDVRAAMQLGAAWIHEMGELNDVLRGGVEALKRFTTSVEDEYVPKYGRQRVRQKRRCVFCGTCNDPRFLKDPTGARRFHPVEAKKAADLKWLRANRDQLWAEAVAMVRKGQEATKFDTDGKTMLVDGFDTPENRHWFSTTDPADLPYLDALGTQHEDFQEDDSWFVEVARKITEWEKNQSVEPLRLTTHKILVEALDFKPNEIKKSDEKRAGDVLRQLGYTRRQRLRVNGALAYVYSKPDQEAPEGDE